MGKGEESGAGARRAARRRGQQTEQSDGTDKEATLEWLGAHIVKAKAETYRKHVLVEPIPTDHKGAYTHTHRHTPTNTLVIYMSVYL